MGRLEDVIGPYKIILKTTPVLLALDPSKQKFEGLIRE